MEFNEHGSRKVYNIDLDGTLTNGELFWLTRPTVNEEMRQYIVDLYKSGCTIIIWTARQWTTAPATVGWLIENEIPFHGLYMAKGGSDCYIDDKALRPEEALASQQEASDG